jgi:hypothetical protein
MTVRTRGFLFVAVVALLAVPATLVWILNGDVSAGRWTNQAAADELTLRLDAPSGAVPSGDRVRVRVTLANASERAAILATPTIVPAILSFRVDTAEGEAVPYAGRFRHLAPLNRSSIVRLGAHSSVSNTFDLADFFALGAGRYRIRASYHNADSGISAKAKLLVTDELASNMIEVHVE